jgi:hypothetical protein
MTLYKGENVEDVIAELEDDQYIWLRRRMQMSEDGQVIRPIFSVLDDDGENCPNDDECDCHWYPSMPLASTTWTEKDEKAWLYEEELPVPPTEVFNEYYRMHVENRERIDLMRRGRYAQGVSSGR